MHKISTPTWLTTLIGNPEEMSLRRRIFHAANLLTCAMLVVVLVINLINKVYSAAILVMFIGAAHGFFFARVHHRAPVDLLDFAYLDRQLQWRENESR